MSVMTTSVHTESLSDCIARWQDWQASTCNTSTIRQRSDDVLRAVEHAADRNGRAVDARDLTTEDLASYLARPGRSANTKCRYAKSFACWYGWLRRTGRIDVDPTADLRRPKPRTGVPNPLTSAELEAVFTGAEPQLAAMMALALYAGLRRHEVAAFRGEQIRMRHLVVVGKGDKDARLPVAAQLADVVARMPRAGWWFPSPVGSLGHIGAEWVGKAVAARFRECGIEQGGVHRLRHTYGTLVHRTHRDILVTQRLLRHASVATTMIYTAVEDADMAEALSGLPRLSA